jgi:L-amino acid N-acyltransferase YncA
MSAEVRELTPGDAPALREFFLAMTPQDRTFFFQDVQDPAVAETWASDARLVRRCARDGDGRILAFAALEPGVEWSRHVAELVLVVAPDARRRGLGRTLARALLVEAAERGFKKVTVLIAADNPGPIEMFRGLGFEGEALLRDQLCSPEDGELRDMVILAHLVDEQWSAMLTGGFGDAVS